MLGVYAISFGLSGSIFPRYLIKGAIFGERALNIKCVLIFSATFVKNICYSEKNRTIYNKTVHRI